MAMLPRRQQILSNAAITGNGNSGTINNLGRDLYPNMLTVWEVTGAVTGTNPTLDFYIEALQPSGNWLQIEHLPQLVATTGTTPLSNTNINVVYQSLRVRWVVGGTGTPTFNGVYIDLYFASPSA